MNIFGITFFFVFSDTPETITGPLKGCKNLKEEYVRQVSSILLKTCIRIYAAKNCFGCYHVIRPGPASEKIQPLYFEKVTVSVSGCTAEEDKEPAPVLPTNKAANNNVKLDV